MPVVFPINYVEPVYRPPSEAESLLIQITIGCSHNACSFCAMYRDKRYHVRQLSEIEDDLGKASRFYSACGETPRKIFLCDGDALAAPTELILSVLKKIDEIFPRNARVGIYASASNILGKSMDDLRVLADNGLRIAYLGVESGSDNVLSLINKRATSQQTSEASLKIKQAGWKLSDIIMLGVGGRRLSREHCQESARLISATSPNFLSFLTTTVVPGTSYARDVADGRIQPLSVREMLHEMKEIIGGIEPEEGRIIFRANHASNFLPIEGILPRDREKLIGVLSEWITACPPDLYPAQNPAGL